MSVEFRVVNSNEMADVESKSSNNAKDNILYDLSVLSEWKLDNEIFVSISIYLPKLYLFKYAIFLVL